MTESLLARARAICFPGGEEAARAIRVVRMTERGELRLRPNADWVPFTAEQEIDATESRFSWTARFPSFTITDAYDNRHGRLTVEGHTVTNPDLDRAELQRYLASLPMCPTMLLHHAGLEFTPIGPWTLRVRDRHAPSGWTVDLEFNESGCPIAATAERPQLEGRHAVAKTWKTTVSDFEQRDGLLLPTRAAASWLLPEGEFQYYLAEIVGQASWPVA